jgi:ribonucleoside-triphosphate reductase (formate)
MNDTPTSISPTHVLKRDGSLRPFELAKIRSALARAGAAAGEFGTERADELAQHGVLPRLFALGPVTPHIEQIQDAVESALFEAGFQRTLRAFIVYREQHRTLRQQQRSLVDVENSMNEYLDQRDWRVNANANQGYSLGGLILNVAGKVTANYWLDHVYPPAVGQAHREGDLHLHDLDMLSGYCAG